MSAARVPSTSLRLSGAFADFDEDASNRLLEESLGLRSVERTVEEVLLQALVAQREPDGTTAEYEFGWRFAVGWLAAQRRMSPPATRREGVLIFDASSPCDLDSVHAQALELVLRRAGMRTLSLTPAIELTRLGRALRALEPSAVVLTGQRVSLDSIGRLVYAVRQVVRDALVFDYRGAVPDTGASTVVRLGESPTAARDTLLARVAEAETAAERARAQPRGGRRRAARPAPPPDPPASHLESARVPAAHRPVDPHASFPELEQRVLERWRERDVFAESLRRREGGPVWSFNEGPPTANGAPGFHHVLARVFKDIFPRYRTMTGHYVERKAGWDCHGLPVELAVEAELGFDSKTDIEEYGIAEFNARCRESVLSHIAEFNELTERIGYWVDLDDAYRTLDTTYVESVWWALKTIYEKGLLQEKHKVVPYCPRDQVTLSSHELGQPGAYRDVIDRSVFVRLPVIDAAGAAAGRRRARRLDDDALDARLQRRGRGQPGAALRPGPHARRTRAGRRRRARRAACSARTPRCSTASPGPSSSARATRRRSPTSRARPTGRRATPCSPRTSSPRPTAPGSSTPRSRSATTTSASASARASRSSTRCAPTAPTTSGSDPTPGRKVKDCDADLIEDLRARGLVLRDEDYEHSYPHCWRCGTALIYYAKPSWYITTSEIKDRLLAANETITWYPEHVKHGRFGKWLENNVDWALSRERYWGTPLPVWRCDHGCMKVIGSLDELERESGRAPRRPPPPVRRRRGAHLRQLRRGDAPRA